MWIAVELIILELFDTLLELDFVSVLRDLFVFWHKIVLKLSLDEELQCLYQILIHLLLFLLFPCHQLWRLGCLHLLILSLLVLLLLPR